MLVVTRLRNSASCPALDVDSARFQCLLQSERHVASAGLVSLLLQSLVLNDQSPSSSDGAADCGSCKGHHNDEGLQVAR